ncbi:MAG: peptide-methionine (R)-S-oxide reductase [Hyphomicrobiaceae bacterium]|nr:peptide-methionine (R)-S-oxide reductase [Hyphomicrobiaceae bacterium]
MTSRQLTILSRIEVQCTVCSSHLGKVFSDGL